MLAVLLTAATALGLLLWQTSGDVPRADEWATPGDYLLAHANGTASFDNLFRQHNESRVIFAQLLSGLIADHWGWNQHIFHGLNWLITIVTAWLFMGLLSRSLAGQRRLDWPVLLIVCSTIVLIFSPSQWRNFLSSGQIITISIPCLLLAGITVNQKVSWSIPLRYGLAALFSLLASFSFINGLLLWFLLWPAPFVMVKTGTLRIPARERWASVIYFAVTIAVIGLFFKGYQSPPAHPPMSYGLRVPHRTLMFALTWLAGPLAPEPMSYWQSVLANKIAYGLCGGLAGVAGLLLGAWVLANRRRWRPALASPQSSTPTPTLPSTPALAPSRELLVRSFPFLPVLGYSLASAGAIALARVGLGSVFGNVSRYSTVAVPAYLGMAGMLAVLTTRLGGLGARKLLAIFAMSFATAVVASGLVGYMQCYLDHSVAKQAALSLELRHVAPTDPLLTNVFQSDDLVAFGKRADDLERRGLLRTGTSWAWVEDQPATPRSDLTYSIRIVDENWLYRLVTGEVSPSAGLDRDDVLLLRDRATGRPVSALMAPAGNNYPGKPAGVFEVRYQRALAEPLPLDRSSLYLLRPRTHEVWKLAAKP